MKMLPSPSTGSGAGSPWGGVSLELSHLDLISLFLLKGDLAIPGEQMSKCDSPRELEGGAIKVQWDYNRILLRSNRQTLAYMLQLFGGGSLSAFNLDFFMLVKPGSR